MSHTLAESIELDHGVTVEIHYDEGDTSHADPREYDNLGTMLCGHRNYNLGDIQFDENGYTVQCDSCDGRGHWKNDEDCPKCEGLGELEVDAPTWAVIEHGATVVLPLYLYDHSGISMSVGRSYPFDCPWDSGQVGIIFDTTESRKMMGFNGKDDKDAIERCLISEVEEYDLYLTGQVYGYVITAPNGDTLDSCWGFLGDKYVKEEALAAAKYHVEDRAKELAKFHHWAGVTS